MATTSDWQKVLADIIEHLGLLTTGAKLIKISDMEHYDFIKIDAVEHTNTDQAAAAKYYKAFEACIGLRVEVWCKCREHAPKIAPEPDPIPYPEEYVTAMTEFEREFFDNLIKE